MKSNLKNLKSNVTYKPLSVYVNSRVCLGRDSNSTYNYNENSSAEKALTFKVPKVSKMNFELRCR